jgi:transcription elongation GreA/GreB family factor
MNLHKCQCLKKARLIFSIIFGLMMNCKDLKTRLFEGCLDFVKMKSKTLQDTMKANQLALENESKSSAGDKHETGRAMLHLEMEKASQQIDVVTKMRDQLNKIDLGIETRQVRLGSLVQTDQGAYFLSISAGPITLEDQEYYAISPSSPVGKSLLGTSEGATVIVGTRAITVRSVC